MISPMECGLTVPADQMPLNRVAACNLKHNFSGKPKDDAELQERQRLYREEAGVEIAVRKPLLVFPDE